MLHRASDLDGFFGIIRVLRRIFGPKREEVTGRQKSTNEELHNMYLLSIDEIKVDETGGVCSTCGRDEKCLHFSRKTRMEERERICFSPRHRGALRTTRVTSADFKRQSFIKWVLEKH
jgi:hypothetical protein